MKLKIKKGATVEVIAGADRGKRGTVLLINPGKLKIKVQGVRVQTKNDKKEGFIKREGFIDYSNVRLIENAPAKKKKPSKKAGKSASKEA